ncbi:MAG: DUF3341 domain-containing protein, partial [Chloroflexi bacterium]|nr:DUF3341 domain-containing protein [Chloroflexota bacterium]
RITVASTPSTTSCRPCLRKSSLTLSRLLSRARRPSRRASSARDMICMMTAVSCGGRRVNATFVTRSTFLMSSIRKLMSVAAVVPPMVIITYEGTMLGAIIFTILGTLFESRLPNLTGGVYDPRIMTEGYIGVVVNGPPERLSQAETIFQSVGAEDVVREAAAVRQPA